uniref:ArsC family reductase n=1 Tax=Siphoviridae sp. ctl0E3 TaxID=2827586 RepID=A0A8S5LP01_9CAUD|nr:MAG TPA: ArsC family reductase [Siphoviridae sp. ctl0E3]DAO25455.1 MAG TPA: ArsC family reductase [Caudoviricetes sp.]DAR53850.1 MAG TPA: ArsC family reductase [Caudoviricetes sp.]
MSLFSTFSKVDILLSVLFQKSKCPYCFFHFFKLNCILSLFFILPPNFYHFPNTSQTFLIPFC